METWIWVVLIVGSVVGYLLWKRWTASIEEDINAIDSSFGEYVLRERLGMSLDEAVVQAERAVSSAVESVANAISASATDEEIRRALTVWFDTKGRFRPSDEQSMDHAVRRVREQLSA